MALGTPWLEFPPGYAEHATPLNAIKLTPRNPLLPIWEDDSIDSQVASGEL